jgi:hypothetical protein
MISPVTIRAICNDVKFPNKNITGDKSLWERTLHRVGRGSIIK